MLLQLSEEKKDLAKALFKKRQPNWSALWCCLNGTMPGKIYVDNLEAPAKAICVADWSWTWCSDDADFHWIEDTLEEITRTAWLQVIWNPAERPQRPSKGLENINPRLEYVGIEDEALAAAREKTGTSVDCTEFKPFSSELFDKCEWKDFHLWIYGSSENFIKKAFGVYAVQGEEICCEGEAAFAAQGYTEIGIITAKNKRRQGYGFATCVRLLEEIKKRGLIPIWACDVANPESSKLAEKLGFKNPLAYDFLYYPQRG